MAAGRAGGMVASCTPPRAKGPIRQRLGPKQKQLGYVSVLWAVDTFNFLLNYDVTYYDLSFHIACSYLRTITATCKSVSGSVKKMFNKCLEIEWYG